MIKERISAFAVRRAFDWCLLPARMPIRVCLPFSCFYGLVAGVVADGVSAGAVGLTYWGCSRICASIFCWMTVWISVVFLFWCNLWSLIIFYLEGCYCVYSCKDTTFRFWISSFGKLCLVLFENLREWGVLCWYSGEIIRIYDFFFVPLYIQKNMNYGK